jgi:pimeloyl-ACP methyl ester carboxylesterase
VALHGGGMSASYFHCGTEPELSLLTLGAAAGWNVLALDRPGYRASADLAAADQNLAAGTEIVYGALDTFAASHEVGAGFFVLAHSYGMELAVHLAAHPRGGELLGLDGSGSGRRFQPGRFGLDPDAPPPRSAQEVLALFWGPRELFPAGTLRARPRLLEPVLLGEAAEAPRWPDAFPRLAPQVRVPVRITMAEHEQWWVADDAELAEIARAFSSAPVVETARLPGAPHNISVSWAARPYHLAALAFAERCLLRARVGAGQRPGLPASA